MDYNTKLDNYSIYSRVSIYFLEARFYDDNFSYNIFELSA